VDGWIKGTYLVEAHTNSPVHTYPHFKFKSVVVGIEKKKGKKANRSRIYSHPELGIMSKKKSH